MILDTDTMNATERALAIIHREEPDRVSTYLMGIPPYSKCHKEYKELERSKTSHPKIKTMITPLGNFTMPYFFGTDIELS